MQKAMEGQQHTPDLGTELYVDDRSTLMRCENLKGIQGLTIVETALGGDEMNALRTCEALVCVSLLHCYGFDDLRVLAELKALQEVYVVTRGWLRHVNTLSQLPALRRLVLNCGNIEESDVHVLNRIPTLEYISLLRNDDVIYEQGPDYVQSNIITDDNVRDLCNGQGFVRMDLTRCRNLTIANSLVTIPTLEVVDLSGCCKLRDVGALGEAVSLKELNVSGSAINDDSVRGLSASRSLVKIDLTRCRNLTIANSLVTIPTLEVVNLSYCENLRDIGALGKVVSLKKLNVSASAVNDDGLRGLSASQSLVSINLRGCEQLTDVNSLATIPTLKVLDVRACFNLENIDVFVENPQLVVLHSFYSLFRPLLL